jgi:hypothetical protein
VPAFALRGRFFGAARFSADFALGFAVLAI